jgi:hypothetical protein
MTITINQPDAPVVIKPKYQTVNADAPPVTFNTAYYEDEHGKLPHHNTRGTWRFMPPLHLGRRPFEFVDMTYSEAKKQVIDAIGERPRYGEFVLIP